MFGVLRGLRIRLGGRLEFHYAGATDPHRYAEYSGVEDCTIRHGALAPDAVAALMRRCHAGLLTSHDEGMPRYLLEMLASGRPFVATRLPQLDPLVVEGVSGTMVDRSAPIEICESLLIDALVELWDEILAGRVEPERIAGLVEPYSIENQMQRLFAHHPPCRARRDPRRRLGRRWPGPPAPAGGRTSIERGSGDSTTGRILRAARDLKILVGKIAERDCDHWPN